MQVAITSHDNVRNIFHSLFVVVYFRHVYLVVVVCRITIVLLSKDFVMQMRNDDATRGVNKIFVF